MDQIKGGLSPMGLDGQIAWGTVGEDGVVVLFTLGSRVRPGWSVLLYDFYSLWAFLFVCLFVYFFPSLIPTDGWWQYDMRARDVHDYTG